MDRKDTLRVLRARFRSGLSLGFYIFLAHAVLALIALWGGKIHRSARHDWAYAYLAFLFSPVEHLARSVPALNNGVMVVVLLVIYLAAVSYLAAFCIQRGVAMFCEPKKKDYEPLPPVPEIKEELPADVQVILSSMQIERPLLTPLNIVNLVLPMSLIVFSVGLECKDDSLLAAYFLAAPLRCGMYMAFFLCPVPLLILPMGGVIAFFIWWCLVRVLLLAAFDGGLRRHYVAIPICLLSFLLFEWMGVQTFFPFHAP